MVARGLIVLLFAVAVTAVAAPVPKKLKALVPSKIDTVRFKVYYDNASYGKVMDDFADGTGLKFVGELPELGPVTLKPRREYSTGEFLDLLNEWLEPHRHILVRHGNTFYLHPSEKPIDREKVDILSAQELKARIGGDDTPVVAGKRGGAAAGVGMAGWNANPWGGDMRAAKLNQPTPYKRGKTEVVTGVIELPDGLIPGDVLPQVKKLLSPFGSVEESKSGKELVVTDRVPNLRSMWSLLNEPPTQCGK